MAERPSARISLGPESKFASVTPMPKGHLLRIRQLRRQLAQLGPRAIIHAHSSFGGLYARLAALTARNPVVYTPHCYGFERADLKKAARAAVYAAEWVMARRTTVVAGCSPHEASLATKLRPAGTAVFVPNLGPQTAHRTGLSRAERPLAPRLVGAGRTVQQKDPEFFCTAVNALRSSGVTVDATWIGGGDAKVEAMLRQADVQVTGWLDREEAIAAFANADVYLHSAAWEGFPIAVLEAAAYGVPTVVRSLDCFQDYDFPFVLSDPREIAEVWPQIFTEDGVERAHDFMTRLLRRHTPDEQARALRASYRAVAAAGEVEVL
nr:glycosyltransferase [Nocardioides dongkuii]